MATVTTKAALVSAYLMGTRARTHDEMIAAVRLSRQLERDLTEYEVAECKLKAEIEYETRTPNPFRHLSDGG